MNPNLNFEGFQDGNWNTKKLITIDLNQTQQNKNLLTVDDYGPEKT